jgi:hypothetical protein
MVSSSAGHERLSYILKEMTADSRRMRHTLPLDLPLATIFIKASCPLRAFLKVPLFRVFQIPPFPFITTPIDQPLLYTSYFYP